MLPASRGPCVGCRRVEGDALVVEGAELRLVPRERPFGVVHPLPGHRRVDVNVHGERPALQLGAGALGEHRAASQRDHGGLGRP